MSWDWGLAPGSTESLRLIRFSRLPGLSGSPGTPGFQVYQVLYVLQVFMFIRFSRFPGLSGPPGYKVALFIRFSMFSGSTDVLQVLQIYRLYHGLQDESEAWDLERSRGRFSISLEGLVWREKDWCWLTLSRFSSLLCSPTTEITLGGKLSTILTEFDIWDKTWSTALLSTPRPGVDRNLETSEAQAENPFLNLWEYVTLGVRTRESELLSLFK